MTRDKTPDIMTQLSAGAKKRAKPRQVLSEPGKAGRPPAVEKRERATFNIAEGVLNQLEDVWLEMRGQAPKSKKKGINKSVIVEAALVEALGDFSENGLKSKMAYLILSDNE